MTNRTGPFRMLLAGAVARLLGAALVVLALWMAFFWATTPPGGS